MPPLFRCHWHFKAQIAFASSAVSGCYCLAEVWSLLLAEKEELTDIAGPGHPHLVPLEALLKICSDKPGTLWRQTLEQEGNHDTNLTKIFLKASEGLG